MPIAASDAVTALTAAFSDRGPRNPRIAFRADGEQVMVTVTASDGGEVTHVFEQPMPCPPAATTPGRLRSFAHGTAMAAQQLATRGAPDALSPDEVYCPELLAMSDLATADAFRRAILDEHGTRATIRAHRATTALAAEAGLPMPDAAGQAILYRLIDTSADRGFADRCDAIREIVDSRTELLPYLTRIALRWADDPDTAWSDEPDTEYTGPQLLAGLLVTLLPSLPAEARAPLAAVLDRLPSVPTADDLRDLGLL